MSTRLRMFGVLGTMALVVAACSGSTATSAPSAAAPSAPAPTTAASAEAPSASAEAAAPVVVRLVAHHDR